MAIIRTREGHLLALHVVGAAIVARRPLTRSEVREHCARHIARFKAPEKITLVTELPRTAMWKVSCKTIAELVQKVAE